MFQLTMLSRKWWSFRLRQFFDVSSKTGLLTKLAKNLQTKILDKTRQNILVLISRAFRKVQTDISENLVYRDFVILVFQRLL